MGTTLRLVDDTDMPLVHDCDSYRCHWRGYALAPGSFLAGWIAITCVNARMVKKVEPRA